MSETIPSLSKVSDITGIRVKDSMHAVDIICQVMRFSPPAASYKYMNCEVLDDEHPEIRHGFPFKILKDDFDQVNGIQPGDIVCLKRPYRPAKERRSSNGYNLRPTDLNIQLESWEESSVEILYSITGEVTKFDLLKLPKKNVCIRGIVEYIPRVEGAAIFMMVVDKYEDLLKIKLPELIDVKKQDELIIRGNLCLAGKILFLDAVKWEAVKPAPQKFVDPMLGNNPPPSASKPTGK